MYEIWLGDELIDVVYTEDEADVYYEIGIYDIVDLSK